MRKDKARDSAFERRRALQGWPAGQDFATSCCSRGASPRFSILHKQSSVFCRVRSTRDETQRSFTCCSARLSEATDLLSPLSVGTLERKMLCAELQSVQRRSSAARRKQLRPDVLRKKNCFKQVPSVYARASAGPLLRSVCLPPARTGWPSCRCIELPSSWRCLRSPGSPT